MADEADRAGREAERAMNEALRGPFPITPTCWTAKDQPCATHI